LYYSNWNLFIPHCGNAALSRDEFKGGKIAAGGLPACSASGGPKNVFLRKREPVWKAMKCKLPIQEFLSTPLAFIV
jgi:hypothetical protein